MARIARLVSLLLHRPSAKVNPDFLRDMRRCERAYHLWSYPRSETFMPRDNDKNDDSRGRQDRQSRRRRQRPSGAARGPDKKFAKRGFAGKSEGDGEGVPMPGSRTAPNVRQEAHAGKRDGDARPPQVAFGDKPGWWRVTLQSLGWPAADRPYAAETYADRPDQDTSIGLSSRAATGRNSIATTVVARIVPTHRAGTARRRPSGSAIAEREVVASRYTDVGRLRRAWWREAALYAA